MARRSSFAAAFGFKPRRRTRRCMFCGQTVQPKSTARRRR